MEPKQEFGQTPPSETRTCVACGAKLNTTPADGLCLACLLEGGLSTNASRGAAETTNPILGDYELLAEIAHGGMGIVYRARQRSLGRMVALKTVLDGRLARAEDIARFRREAEAAAHLKHPNIVAIHEVGESDGQHFFSMDYIAGQTLRELTRDNPLPAQRTARYLKLVADAVAYAHQQGVIHRDLKPSNVLIDADDQPHVTDFGLAKRIGTDPDLTLSGAAIGTPGYMAPEQAAGSSKAAGPLADIYALGAMLYDLLTGRPPHRAATPIETLVQTVHEEPVTPRLLNPGIPRDLEIICLKCLAKEPARRYASASELADDLDRYLRHETIKAVPPSSIYRARKFIRRHRVGMAVACAIGTILGLATIVSTIFGVRATQTQQLMRQRLARSFVKQGSELVESGQFFKGLPWFVEALKLEQNDPGRAEAHRRRIASVLDQSPRLVQWWRHAGAVDSASFSQDGRWVLTAGQDGTVWVRNTKTGEPAGPPLRHVGQAKVAAFDPAGRRVITGADSVAQVWDFVSGQPLAGPWKHRHRVYHVEFSHDGTKVSIACADGTARIWDATTGEPVTPPLQHKSLVVVARFSPDDRFVLTASADNTARLWNSTNGEPVTSSLRHAAWVMNARFSPDGRYFLTASMDNCARLWEVESGRLVHNAICHENGLSEAIFSPDGRRIVSRSIADNAARIWEAQSGKELLLPLVQGGTVSALAFHPDGRWLATGGADQTTRLWDVLSGQPMLVRLPHNATVTCAEFSPDGRYLVTASRDYTARLWDLVNLDLSYQVLAHTQTVSGFCFSPTGERLLTAGRRAAQLWNLADGQPLSCRVVHGSAVHAVAFSRDGQQVLTAGSDGTARVSSALTGELVFAPLQHPTNVVTALYSADGSRILTACDDGVARLWESANGRLAQAFQHGARLRDAAIDPTGRRIATAGSDSRARIWDAVTGQLLVESISHGAAVESVAFSSDGRRVVTCSYDHTGRVWDAVTGKPIGQELRHNGEVRRANFSPDGRRVVTSSYDGTARIWDALTGHLIGAPLQHANAVSTARFSPDNRWVVTACVDATARVWDAVTGEPMTPPLVHGFSVEDAAFSPDQTRVATASEDGQVRIWPWRDLTNTMEQLEPLVSVLAGGSVNNSGAYSALAPDDLDRSWTQARQQRSDWLSDRIPQAAWHQRRIAVAEAFVPNREIKVVMRGFHSAGTWDTVESSERFRAIFFHLGQLCRLDPNNAVWRQRWSEAKLAAERPVQTEAETSDIDPAAFPTVLKMARQSLAANRPDDAEVALRRLLRSGQRLTPDPGDRRDTMALLGEVLLRQQKYVEAEELLRKCLPEFEQHQPGLSPTFAAQGLLGWALLGQKRYDEATPHLEGSYKGLEKRQNERPTSARGALLKETAARLVQAHEARNDPTAAALWREKAR